ncbi:MAG: 3'-5' exoribonuclease [Rhodoplanes sp.]|uniref:3'-5' exonuclease n=1 Tax=Rhodoplanes sp. TaxID=1968906 RepID=UPI0017EDD849|nr:3'-5' exonuclease [Rhodoplanes sp.]NVO13847.1 3'-5' exoribonuclease [Rhodoplanes sp.]
MLDIETLGTRPGAVVLSAAFVRFSDLASVSLVMSVPDQQALGLEIDPETHAWWGKQDPAAWAAATQNPLPLRAALEHIAAWIAWASNGEAPLIWGHGASFDAPLLGEVFRRAGVPKPWGYRDERDTRTLYDLAGINLSDHYGQGTMHVALSDAMAQTSAAIAAITKLLTPSQGRQDAVIRSLARQAEQMAADLRMLAGPVAA